MSGWHQSAAAVEQALQATAVLATAVLQWLLL